EGLNVGGAGPAVSERVAGGTRVCMPGKRARPFLPTFGARRDCLGSRRSDTRAVSAAGPAVPSLLCESRPHAEQVARVHRVHANGESEGAEVSAPWITPHSRATGFGRLCVVVLAVPAS